MNTKYVEKNHFSDPGCRLCSNGSETHDDWSSLPDQSRKIGASLGNVLLEKDNNISGCQSSQVCQNEVGILHSCVQGNNYTKRRSILWEALSLVKKLELFMISMKIGGANIG